MDYNVQVIFARAIMQIRNSHNAFSLVELMVVISILAILAVTAVTSYRDYMIRGSIASLMPLADRVKNEVEDAHNQGTVFGNGSSQIYVANSSSDKPFALYSMSRVSYGCVDIQIDLAALDLDPSQTLILTWCPTIDNASIEWQCGYDSASASAYLHYLPAICQSSSSSIQNASF